MDGEVHGDEGVLRSQIHLVGYLARAVFTTILCLSRGNDALSQDEAMGAWVVNPGINV